MSNALVKSRNNPTCTFLIKSWNNAIGTSLLSSVLLFYVVCSMKANNCISLYVLITLVIPEFIKLQYQSNISEEFRNMIWCSSHFQTLLFGRISWWEPSVLIWYHPFLSIQLKSWFYIPHILHFLRFNTLFVQSWPNAHKNNVPWILHHF
jgi:hypothetical protein